MVARPPLNKALNWTRNSVVLVAAIPFWHQHLQARPSPAAHSALLNADSLGGIRDDFTNAGLTSLSVMTLQDWGSVGELVGGVAVIATLIYLAIQTRQARRIALAQAPQWSSDRFRHWIRAPRDDTELADLLIRANHCWSELSPVDQFKAHCWWVEKVVHLDAILTLHEQGVIDNRRKGASKPSGK